VVESPHSPEREIGEERDELMGARGYWWNTKDNLRRIQMCTCVRIKRREGAAAERTNKEIHDVKISSYIRFDVVACHQTTEAS
jgi:hypothetical protein